MSPNRFDPVVASVVARLLPICEDDEVRSALQKRLLGPDVALLASAGDDYLFRVPMCVREELQHYEFFFMGRLIEIRRMGFASDDYSIIEFPHTFEPYRTLAQERFTALVLSTEDGMGWFAPARWEQLNDEQKAVCTPKFVTDGRQYDSM